MSIQDSPQKIKGFLDSPKGHDLLIILILLATAVGSFMLGRTMRPKTSPVVIQTDPSLVLVSTEQALKAKSTGSPTIQNQTQAQMASVATSTQKGDFVASKRGKRYYPVDCSGAKTLKESNKIYFQTAGEAEQKGYTLSDSCN
jgi:hypothetical protein